ncbi:MAG: NUDIX hydrolase [Proteobacteria bacterium]|nr:NUDIX hydrolase [Pseudomonadota bacterium]
MSPPRPWKVLARETLQDCAVFQVGRTRALSPATGDEHTFYRIDSADWVNVVPLTSDDQIVMIRQYRHGADQVTLEIPGGLIDPGEAPVAAAARELLEETGYGSTRVEPVGVVNPNPALFGNRCHTFVARDAAPVAEIQNTATEETAVELVPRNELPQRLQSGEIDHALVVAGLYWFALSEG